jgi:hypothetical protein
MGICLLYSQADWAASLDQDREHSRVLTVYANQTNIEALALLLLHLQFSKHASVSVADPSSAPSARLDIVLLFTTALSSSQQLAPTSPTPSFSGSGCLRVPTCTTRRCSGASRPTSFSHHCSCSICDGLVIAPGCRKSDCTERDCARNHIQLAPIFPSLAPQMIPIPGVQAPRERSHPLEALRKWVYASR